MGWWWSSTPGKDEQPRKALQQPPAAMGQASQTSQPPAKPRMTRDEIADAELREFLASLEGESAGNSKDSSNPTLPPAPSSPAHTREQPPTTSASDNVPRSIAPESLYPDTMSCRSAFDYAFFCQSFGGQWVNVYRYGELRSCSEHWENFWLCMKARSYSDGHRKEVFRDHYRKKAVKYKTGPSSEDVWDVRTEPLTDAFQGDFAALQRRMMEEEAAAAVS